MENTGTPTQPGRDDASRPGLRKAFQSSRLRAAMGSVVRRIGGGTDRVLHPLRRRRALDRLRGSPAVSTVLFVCHGNIFRSPYAQIAFVDALPEPHRSSVRTASAGFVGPDRGSPESAVQEAARRGLDLTAHRSALLTRANVHAANLVVVMSARQRRAIREEYGARPERVLVLGDLDPEPIARREVVDPWKGSAEVLRESYARIDRCLPALVDAVVRSREPDGGTRTGI